MKTLAAIIMTVLSVVFLEVNAQPAGYGYGKEIQIQSSKVSGNLSDFPVLISFTDSNLRTVANGGRVQNSNGYDIRFTTSNCSTVLSHQIEYYNASTGNYIAWVKVPSLSSSANTILHMYYGNASVATNPSSTGVWSSSFVGVWHLNEDPSSTAPQMRDGTSNAFHATSVGSMTSGDLVTGKIANSIDFDGSNDGLQRADNTTLSASNTSLTLSAWTNIPNTSTVKEIINKKAAGGVTNGYALRINGGNVQVAYRVVGGDNVNVSTSTAVATNTWLYIAAVFNRSTNICTVYINGVAETGITLNGAGSADNTEPFGIGYRAGPGDDYMLGKIDEARMATTARSGDWIATEFNNQDSPSTFYSVSAEGTASQICSGQLPLLPVEIVDFNATVLADATVRLAWQTASEINNDYFIVEKLMDELQWEAAARIDGAGDSFQALNYSVIDSKPNLGLTYYRLKQVDHDGTYSTSAPIAVHLGKIENRQLVFYPNPTEHQITLQGSQSDRSSLRIFNVFGQEVTELAEIIEAGEHQSTLDLSKLPVGVYFMKSQNAAGRLYKK